jgi:hypothetical protein
MDSWMRLFSPAVDWHLPASGDVTMDYKPRTNWGYLSTEAGSPEMEDELFQVALPGKQLGRAIEAIVALTRLVEKAHPGFAKLDRQDPNRHALDELKDLADRIGRKKEALQKTAKGQAIEALERLQRDDRQAYGTLVEELKREKQANRRE